MHRIKSYNIFGIKIADISYNELLDYIEDAIKNKKRVLITYATTHTLNNVYNNSKLKNIFNDFDLIHMDGIGTFYAMRFLFGIRNIKNRSTGSDFYPKLIERAIKSKWQMFFWGDKDDVLKYINIENEGMIVCGYNDGYNYNYEDLCKNVNRSNPDILIVGLGTPLQESLILKLRYKLNPKVVLAVGDGIKVFAGIRKRGPYIFRKIGLEWIYRLYSEPRRLWRRYLVGNPLLVFRIFKSKFLKKK